MINIKEGGGQGVESAEKTPLEVLEAMSPAEVREAVTKMLAPEEISQFTDQDFQLVARIARRLLDREKSNTVGAALNAAAEIRSDARETLGSAGRSTFVQDERGDVIASGANEIDAMKRAREETGR